jgi:hypothetical protein
MASQDSNNRLPRVLVISFSQFSQIKSNGKTFESFFENYPRELIAQLYFAKELPDSHCCENYFRITDNDVLNRLLGKTKTCGRRISENEILDEIPNITAAGKKNVFKRTTQYNLPLLLRELMWKTGKWKTDELNKWLDEFNPDVIFSCVGDNSFGYDIIDYVKKRYNTKSSIYFTDDYILPRGKSPFFWIRRMLLLKKTKRAVGYSDLLFTVSREMQQTYKNIFGKDSVLAVNMTESMRKDSKNIKPKDKDIFKIVYTGGLHSNRYKTLALLGRALSKYNNENENSKKAILNIYSSANPSETILSEISIENSSKFCGSLTKEQVKDVLNDCDMPVHVESFDKKSIYATILSISTKIPEYLSLRKCVLAIGPGKVSSMKYLSDIAFCINDTKEIYIKIKEIIGDADKREYYAERALNAFETNHDSEKTRSTLLSNIIELYKENKD